LSKEKHGKRLGGAYIHCYVTYQVKLVINDDRKDCSKSIVGGVSFHHKLMVREPMMEDQSMGEGLFQHLESGGACVVEVPWSTLLGEPS